MKNSSLNHIAIIMDGNSRWAIKNSFTTQEGHKQGAETAKLVIESSAKIGVKYLTLYAFSSENWGRPEEEVNAIKKLLEFYLSEGAEQLLDKGVKLNFIGDYSAFGRAISERCEKLIDKSKSNDLINVNIALNYGSKQEIVNAAKTLCENNEEITIANIEKNLYTNKFPDPDLLIRTGGDKRISNFLLWQSAYTEIYFSDILWPDFNDEALKIACEDFKKRERRFGGR